MVVEGELQLCRSESEQSTISPETPSLELLKFIESTVNSVGLDEARSIFELRFDGDRKIVLLADIDYES